MRIAVIADIHGNLPALLAVLTELERAAPDFVVVNGDLINGIPFSTAVVDEIRQRDWIVIRGNHEFYYLDYGTVRALPGSDDHDRWGQLHWLVDQITPEQGYYLATLPDERTFYLPGTQPIRMAHGVPGNNRVGFYTDQPDLEVVEAIQPIDEETLISAHTHLQIDRHIYWNATEETVMPAPSSTDKDPLHHCTASPTTGLRHWHVINPGSVGLPLNGRPTAQFALLDHVGEDEEAGGWRVTHCETPYDRAITLTAYHESGMLTAGGVISQLFYWEVVTAEAEIVLFYRWAWQHGFDPDQAIYAAFKAYIAATGRDEYVRERDPLQQRKSL